MAGKKIYFTETAFSAYACSLNLTCKKFIFVTITELIQTSFTGLLFIVKATVEQKWKQECIHLHKSHFLCRELLRIQSMEVDLWCTPS